MKGLSKFLSVLLIIGAIGGFYGGATGLKDMLDCKDYWEEEGKVSDEQLDMLDDGILQLKDNEQDYMDGVIELTAGEKELLQGKQEYAEGLAEYEAGKKELEAGAAEIAAGEEDLASLEELIGGLKQITQGYTAWEQGFYNEEFLEDMEDPGLSQARTLIIASVALSAEDLIALLGGDETAFNLVNRVVTADDEDIDLSYADFNAAVLNLSEGLAASKAGLEQLDAAITDQSESGVTAGLNYYGAILIETDSPEALAAVKQITEQIKPVANFDAEAYTYVGAILTYEDAETVGGAAIALTGRFPYVHAALTNEDPAGVIPTLEGTIESLTAFNEGYGQLQSGQAELSAGLKQCLEGMLDNEEMAQLIRTLLTGEQIQMLLNLNLADMDDFYDAMSYLVVPMLNETAIPMLEQVYAEGAAELAAGKKEYAEGKAALEAGARELEAGAAEIAAGEKQLAEGKKQLAEYEDGESQLKEGLDTLIGQKTYTGIKSVLERLGKNFNYMKANGKNIDLTKATTAAKTGREFSDDTEVKIQGELVKKGVGFGCVLGAALLALIAGILGLSKKRKGAGICSLLAAVAGVAGIVALNMAGTEMSAEAGSTLSGFGLIWSAVLVAAVAAVAMITFFGSKDEAAE